MALIFFLFLCFGTTVVLGRSFIHKLCDSFTFERWSTRMQICLSGPLRKPSHPAATEQQSYWLNNAGQCKPQLIRFGPLYYCCRLNLNTHEAVSYALLVCVWHHFLFNLDLFPVPWSKGRRLRLRESGREVGREGGMTFTHEQCEERRKDEEKGQGIGQLLLGNGCKHRKRREVAPAAAGRLTSQEKPSQRAII